MLSIFPFLFSYEQLAPFLLRITLGAVLILWAYQGLKNKGPWSSAKSTNTGQLILGTLLVIGLYTQAAAAFVCIGLLVYLFKKIRSKAFLTDGVNYSLILLVIGISLLFTGAGAFSIDLPL